MAFFLSKQPNDDRRLGIYVHVPFCKSKCEYCDFYSIGGARDRRLTDDYLQALADHIREAGRLAPDHIVDTVYFGGGTPSFFGADNLEKVLDEIHRSFRLSVEAEITVEANPDSVNVQGLKRMLRAGFNRLSLGVQSDDDDMLRRLGRPHNFAQAQTAMQKARQVGFANISLDLMYGLPGQSRLGWQETVEHIARMRPEHISCYALKVEEGTPLYEYKDAANLPGDDVQADMYLDACEILKSFGFEHYEISNFAKRGFSSRHNMKYWTGGEYLGFGPTAASDFDGKRFTAIRNLRGYIQGIADHGEILSEVESVPLRERAGEYIMLRLRTAEGVSAEEYERGYLMPFAPLAAALERFRERGFAEYSHDRWRLTEKGWLVSNRIIIALQDIQERSVPLTKKR